MKLLQWRFPKWVFTLQSIKSRIETSSASITALDLAGFLLYSPLNQGLKLEILEKEPSKTIWFLLYSPLNQGLKLYVPVPLYILMLSFYSTVH